MKKLLVPIAFLAVFFHFSCSNDFEVSAPWKEVPVTYARLDATKPVQYIRVEKAFIDPTVSALKIARIADSLYYGENEITVFIEKSDGTKKLQCTRVDGNLEGFRRDTGIFADSPNWLYKCSTEGANALVPGSKYRVVIKRNDGGTDIVGETIIPDKIRFASPDPANLPARMVFDTAGAYKFAWSGDPNAVYYDLTCKVRYREEDVQTGQVVGQHSINWTVVRNQKRSANSFYTEYNSGSFFQLLADSIAPSSSRYRYINGLDFTLTGGGKEIEQYQETVSANSGITGAEVVPLYTNMSEGYGLVFAVTSIQLEGTRIEERGIKNIQDNYRTKALNFKF